MTAIQRPTLALGACMGTPAHDWRVSAWAEIEPDADNPGRGRAAVAFYCTRCLAQVDADVLYAERPQEDHVDIPAGDPRAHAGHLRRLRDELAQAAVIGDGTPDGEEASARAAALDVVLAALTST